MRPQTLVVSFAGLALCGFGVWLGREGRRAASWPTTDGEVAYSEAVETPRWSGERKLERRDERPDVRYRYSVEGRHYTGKGISMSTGLVPYWEDVLARRIVERYPVGSKVTVHYDPSDPRVAVLEPGASIESWLALLAGVGCLGYGILARLWSRD